VLHQDIHRFYYKICENGHIIHNSSGEVSARFCSICGASFITKCPNCSKPLNSTFSSPVFTSSGEPIHQPNKPGVCGECGEIFPWTLRDAAKIELTNVEALAIVRRMCSRFHSVVRQLCKRYDDRPSLDIDDEYDVQDLLHAILWINFNDIRTEEWTPTYAGGSARMDFLLKEYGIVIETKKTRKAFGSKEIGRQLIDDIAKYKQSPDCKTLICFIYDPEERINNRDGLINDLEALGKEVNVKVVISPSKD